MKRFTLIFFVLALALLPTWLIDRSADAKASTEFDETTQRTGSLTISDEGSGFAKIGAESLVAVTESKLLASDGAASDRFGISVAVSGHVALVGAPQENENGEGAGAAYVYRWDGSTWQQEQKLLASDATGAEGFGISVSLFGSLALVGAPYDNDNGELSGSAYLYRWDGSSWQEEQKLLADDGAAGDWFGWSVSINGNYALVGAPQDGDHGEYSGSAYLFHWNGSSWQQTAKVTANDGAAEDRFATSVSINGDLALVGAVSDDDNGDESGSAYLFRLNQGAWPQEAKLTAADGASSDFFGSSLSVGRDVALIGAYGDDDNGSSSGSAYVFRLNEGAWTEEAKLTASDGSASDWFGYSVGLDGDSAVVGAHQDDDSGSRSGSAYLFRHNNGTWQEEDSKLLASDGSASDFFGYSASISGDHALVGAYGDDEQGSSSGSAYLFRVNEIPNVALSPPSISVALLEGTTTSQMLTINNNGASDLNWTLSASDDSSWLVATATTGLVAANSSGSITINIDATNLSAGNYYGRLTISNQQAEEQRITVPVWLTVTPPHTPTPTPSHTPTPTPTSTRTNTPTPTPTPSPTPSHATLTPAATSTGTISPTSTPTATSTGTISPTSTPAATSTGTISPTSTPAATNTGTISPTSTPAATSTGTISPTSTPTATSTGTISPTSTPTATSTGTISPTSTSEPTSTGTISPTSTSEPTSTGTISPTSTPTPTTTGTISPTSTPSPTSTTPSDTPVSDLAITMSGSPDPAREGEQLTVVISVTNRGPATVTDTTVLNTLPLNVTFDSATASQGSCVRGVGITCDLGTLADGESVTVTVVVSPTTTGRLTNVAKISSSQFDPNPDNNIASQEIIVSKPGIEITSLSSDYGLDDVPTLLYIEGFGFESASRVTLGNQELKITHHDAVLIVVEVPAGLEPNSYDLSVETDSEPATLARGYQVLDAAQVDDLLSSPEFLKIEPVPLREGKAGQISLLVQRLGGENPLDDVTVEFRLDSLQGESLGSKTIPAPLPSNSISETTPLAWTPYLQGTYTIFAIINPDNNVPETNDDNNVITRTITVLPAQLDTEPPAINRFVIADDAQTTMQQTISLDVQATDHPKGSASGMEAIKFIEFEYILGARRWVPIQQSPWVDYSLAQTNYPWTLIPTYGMRYMQAWGVDKSNNVNISLRPNADVIDLLPTTQEGYVAEKGVVFYRFYLEAGDTLTSTLDSIDGDADLYVWAPRGEPWYSNNSATDESEIDQVTFTAPFTATYQIEVHGYSDAEYSLTFNQPNLRPAAPRTHTGPRPVPEEPAVSLNEWPEYYDVEPPVIPEPKYTLYLPLTIR